jgi:hypothetical protein
MRARRRVKLSESIVLGPVCHRADCAFLRAKGECVVVVVSADVTFCHFIFLSFAKPLKRKPFRVVRDKQLLSFLWAPFVEIEELELRIETTLLPECFAAETNRGWRELKRIWKSGSKAPVTAAVSAVGCSMRPATPDQNLRGATDLHQ